MGIANVAPSHLSPLGASQFFSPRPAPPVAGFLLSGVAIRTLQFVRGYDGDARRQPAASASLSLQNQRSPRALLKRTVS